MKKQLLFLLCCALFFNASAQVNIQWQKRYSSSGSFSDKAEDMVMDASGNIYVTGVGRGASGTLDYVTIKYNSSGTQQWVAEYNGPGNGLDEAHAIAIDPSGNNIYVTGWSYTDSIAGFDFVTLKYNSSGVRQWTARYNNTGVNGTDEAFDVAVDNSGNVYVTGTSDGTSGTSAATTIKYSSLGVQQIARRYTGTGGVNAGFALYVSPTANLIYVTGYAYQGTSSDFNIVTIRYSNTITQRWAVQYNGPASKYDEARALAVDPSGNVIVAGYSQTATPGNYDYVTLKYDSVGAQKWAKTYNGTGNDYDRANTVKTDAVSNIYVTGKSIGTGSNAEDIVTIKYDKSGNVKWISRYNGPANSYDEGKAIAIDASRNVYITGSSNTTGSGNDYITLKYDSTGVQQWVTTYNGTGNNADLAAAILLDASNNVFITGASKGSGTLEDYETIKYCQFTASAGADVSICPGASTSLNASGTGAVAYSWSPSTGLSNASIANPVATPASTTTYVVSVTNGSGCIDQDTVVVTVVPLAAPAITADGPTTFCFGKSVKLTSVAATRYKWSTSPNDTLQSITVSTSGTYSVTIKNSIGCSASTSINVTVNPLPGVDGGFDGFVCANKKIQLNASGALTYTWKPTKTLSDSTIANPIASPTITTTYTVVGTNSNGCQNKDSVKVTVLSIPVADAGVDTSICKNASISLKASSANSYTWHPGKSLSDSTIFNPIASPTQTTTYTLTVTGVNGCSNVDSVKISLLSLPTITVSNDVSACKSKPVQLNAGGGTTYVWHPGASLSDSTINNPVATPLVTTTYTVTGASDVGCKTTDTVKVTVLALPAVPVITQDMDTLICSPGFFAYQWYFNNTLISGATNPKYLCTANGNYYLSVTNSDGCSVNSLTKVVTSVGIHENASTVSVNVFPNPTMDEVTIEFNLLKATDVKMNLINASGQTVQSLDLKQIRGGDKKLIDLRNYANGIYYLQILTNEGFINKKIFKQE
ncbi:MAG TPA: SBBP repeat-containing protein [Bacteroidia bacterium]|jgi:hypothetical protein|nr:SBBP repeat-containing protein [Bacteroidia bacterium]